MCFSWSCLTISKYTHVEAIKNRTNQWLCIWENLRYRKQKSNHEKNIWSDNNFYGRTTERPTLGWRRTKDSVEIKCLLPVFPVFGWHYEWDTSFIYVTDRALMIWLGTFWGTNSTVHPNISYSRIKFGLLVIFRICGYKGRKLFRLWPLEFYLSGLAIDYITCGFLQEFSDILKQQKLGHAGVYLLRVGSNQLDYIDVFVKNVGYFKALYVLR